MTLTPGNKLLLAITIGVFAIGIPMIWICWVVSIIIGVLYAGFITLNILLNKYCTKLIEKDNLEVEEYAKVNGYQVKQITPEMYDKMMKHGTVDIGDNIIISKREVEYI